MIVEVRLEIDALLEHAEVDQRILGCDEVGELGHELFIGDPILGRGQNMFDDLGLLPQQRLRTLGSRARILRDLVAGGDQAELNSCTASGLSSITFCCKLRTQQM